MSNKTPPNIQKRIVRLYLDGKSLTEIQDSCQISAATILKYVRQANIPLRQHHTQKRDENSHYCSHYMKKYGLSYEKYIELYNNQNGMCAICGLTNGNKKLYVDHCHTTGEVRGLLCNSCNIGLGGLKDSIKLMEKAIEYLSS